jgi:hypothetical protein
MVGGPGSRPQSRAIVQDRCGFETGHPLLHLVQNPFVNEVVVWHFPMEVSNRTFPLIVEDKRLFFFGFLFVIFRLLIVHVNRYIFSLFVALLTFRHPFECQVMVYIRHHGFQVLGARKWFDIVKIDWLFYGMQKLVVLHQQVRPLPNLSRSVL